MLLKDYRAKLDMTQKNIANYLGISERQYQRIENGEAFPNKKVLNALEDLFEKPQRVLLAKRAEEVPNYMKQYL
ncbi:helix-turn-helix transcriptional regulator [Enterococcus villorum]|uniref:helix-turn-helix transcriptional regulator n=1 Tax=Enterococcus TaxID=1350 RepID=UPI00362F12A6